MTISRPTYTTREAVKARLDVKMTARMDGIVDDAIQAAAEDVDRLCHRQFWPQVDSRAFDWPSRESPTSWRLWLDQHELISITALTAGGTTIAPADYLLYPVGGPPYTRIEINLGGSAAFAPGSTYQQAIVISGLFGYGNDETAAGTLAALLDGSSTVLTVSNSAAVGVGDLIRIDDERMLVTGRTSVDTGQNLAADLAASAAAAGMVVADGSAYALGETLTVDTERVRVEDITGNVLTVRRAWDGSTLAAHTSGADIYAPRTLTVVRGYGGTSAAAHTQGTAVRRHVAPALVRQLARAEALATVQQEAAAYARVVGSGENEREASGRGVKALREDVYGAYGRKARIRAV